MCVAGTQSLFCVQGIKGFPGLLGRPGPPGLPVSAIFLVWYHKLIPETYRNSHLTLSDASCRDHLVLRDPQDCLLTSQWLSWRQDTEFHVYCRISCHCHIPSYTVWIPASISLLHFFLLNQDIMYQSDGPNYPLIRTLLNSLQQDLRLFIDPPDGTKERPATTCLELMICHPNYTDGITLIHHSHFTYGPCLIAHTSD